MHIATDLQLLLHVERSEAGGGARNVAHFASSSAN